MRQLFLCYRRAGAQTAKLFSFFMKKKHPEINVWYSDIEPEGNYSLDIPSRIGQSYGAVLFLSKGFTNSFLDKEGNINCNRYRTIQGQECITVQEIIEIERNLQARPEFELHVINLDGAKLGEKDQQVLRTVFDKAGVLKNDSVAHFSQRNINPFFTARDHEDSFFDRMIGSYLPNDMESYVHGNLSIGNHSTTIDVLCWDCKQYISPNDIVFELDGSDQPFYSRIEAAQFSTEDNKQDDDVVSVVQFEQSLTTNDERKHLLLRCKLIKYHLFKKTLDLWNSNGFTMSKEIAYYLNADENNRYYPIPNAMGLALMVVTSDNKLVFSQRSTRRRVRSNEFDCSIVEGLLPKVDKTVGDEKVFYSYSEHGYIQNECRRAFCEEICTADRVDVKLFGLILDRKYGQWNLAGFIRTDLTSRQIESGHALRDDTTESNQLHFIDYRDEAGDLAISKVRDAVLLFREYGLWDTALAVLVGTLSSLGFKQEEIDSLI